MSGELVCEDIVPILKREFGALWHCRPRGNTLEVITPFSTTTQKFVSVFITRRGEDLIVSDGGWLEGGADFYCLAQDTEEEEYRAYTNHFGNAFGVFSSLKPDGERVFFKKCGKLSLLSSAVYDLSNFVASVVNTVSSQNEKSAESDHKKTFRKQANEFILERFLNAKFNQGIDGLERTRFNAVLVYPSAISLVCYVTGSTPHYFSSDLRRAITNFELANDSRSAPFIKSRVALLNNAASGYSTDRNEELMRLLRKHKGQAVSWKDKENLVQVLQA